MNAWLRVLLTAVLLLLARHTTVAQRAQCDSRQDCVFNGIRLSVTTLPNAHFIEVQGTPTQPRQQALTVELWAKITRQAGKRQFIGGLWGPGQDDNDQWVLYIDEQDRLTFELNAEGSRLQQIDNTIARSSFAAHYGTWTHIAAVFDGSATSATLYVNGLPTATATNPQYPVRHLKPMARGDLSTRFGSSNSIADDQNVYRTLSGEVDEIRMWSRVVSDFDIRCNKDRSLQGNEAGLVLYYRCNEPVNNNLQTCDAANRNHTGLLRAGASNQRSDRVVPQTVVISPASVTQEINCDTVASWTFTFTDTGFCASTATLRMRGPNANRYTISQTNLTLQPNTPVSITLTYRGTNVGAFIDTLEFRPTNRCGLPNRMIVLRLTRTTELGYSRGSIQFDTLYVGCVQKTYIDSTITICNTSDKLGTPRTVRITQFRTREPQGFAVVSPTAPVSIPPGQCITVTVRSFVRDTTNDYTDSLTIISDDRCQSVPSIIPLAGRSQEVISIRNSGGSRRIDTIRFSNTCPGQLSNPVEYTWQNLTLAPLVVDTIIVPPDFTHYRIRFPNTLQPATGYAPIAVRFRPRNPGNVFDSIIIKTKIQGCDIERKIYVRGRGFDNKVAWSSNGTVDFGDVIVGQERTINVTATNTSSIDTLNISLYVERGNAFSLLAGTGRRLLPGQSVTVPVTFRPTDSLTYTDRLCLFETRCYTVDCIPLRGRGILEKFRFSPLVMRTENVVGCRDSVDTVRILNMTSQAQTLTEAQFVNASGRFAVVSPPLPWSQFTIGARDSLTFVIRYTPNDVTQDRADRAYIRYKNGGEDWQVQLIATSATPKLFVPALTSYGTLEVGDRRTMMIPVENTSSMPVTVDSVSVPAGFRLVSTSRPLPTVLSPRDSFLCEVEFAPTQRRNYSGAVIAYSSAPCRINGSGMVSGRGIIVELEQALSLINFGYVRPCECTERVLPLLNASLVFDMIVDSLWMSGQGIARATPEFYTWRSKYSPTGTLPYTIPPSSRDTVIITFCPRSPAEDTLMDCQALVHIKARGSGWNKTTETFLAGKRSLTFRPLPVRLQFAPGPVDVLSAAPLRTTIKIPGILQNPLQDEVTIDSVTFTPNERVFFMTNPAPTAFPVRIRPGDSLVIDVRQRPRAPRLYEARLTLHFSTPCGGFDTTVLVRGSGFAQPRGLLFSFDPPRMLPDTFSMISCDTLTVPIWSSIGIDASVVDVSMRLDFDTLQLRLVDVQSPLLSRTCRSATGGLSFNPSISITPAAVGGYTVLCKNFCGIDSLSPFAFARFVTASNNRVNSPLTVDSINFDTEDVLIYRLIANGDDATVLALKSEIAAQLSVPFDSVRVLDCEDRTVTVRNTGDLPNTIDAILGLAPDVQLVASVPPLGSTIAPGDSLVATLRFCPSRDYALDTSFRVVSRTPCETRDTTLTTGQGFAPVINVGMMATRTFYVADSIKATIGDTIAIPVMLATDIAADYRGRRYWLNGLSFDVDVTFNPRALKFIGARQLAERTTTVSSIPGSVRLSTVSADTLSQGTFAVLDFVVAVPDAETGTIAVRLSPFAIDSLPFLTVVTSDTATPLEISGQCNIRILQFSSVADPVIAVRPMPVENTATITFRMQETVPVRLVLTDGLGRVVRTLLDGSIVMAGGEYEVSTAVSDLPSGMYTIRIEAGEFTGVTPLLLAR